MKEHLPWLVPLLLTLLVAGGKLYTIVGDVDELKDTQKKIVFEAQLRVSDLENRMTIVEKYCCEGEVK